MSITKKTISKLKSELNNLGVDYSHLRLKSDYEKTLITALTIRNQKKIELLTKLLLLNGIRNYTILLRILSASFLTFISLILL